MGALLSIIHRALVVPRKKEQITVLIPFSKMRNVLLTNSFSKKGVALHIILVTKVPSQKDQFLGLCSLYIYGVFKESLIKLYFKELYFGWIGKKEGLLICPVKSMTFELDGANVFCNLLNHLKQYRPFNQTWIPVEWNRTIISKQMEHTFLRN